MSNEIEEVDIERVPLSSTEKSDSARSASDTVLHVWRDKLGGELFECWKAGHPDKDGDCGCTPEDCNFCANMICITWPCVFCYLCFGFGVFIFTLVLSYRGVSIHPASMSDALKEFVNNAGYVLLVFFLSELFSPVVLCAAMWYFFSN